MKHEINGFVLFGVVSALAAALYWFTLPEGIPWGVAAMPFGALGDRPLPIPYYLLPALAAGCLCVLVDCYFGWRVGFAVGLAWIFVPWVWDGAILGRRTVLYVSIGLAGLLFINAILFETLTRAAATRRDAQQRGRGVLWGAGFFHWQMRVNRIASWAILVAAVLFAGWSLWTHDYRLGEAASAYARGVVEAAGDRTIVLDGVIDAQIRDVYICSEPKPHATSYGSEQNIRVLSLKERENDMSPVERMDWVRRECPGDEALARATRRDAMSFLTLALVKCPDRFYLMNGDRTTPEQWDRRWEQFGPYLGSSDAFVPVARRYFAYEANAVANRLQETDKAAAWALYRRVIREVDAGNIAALVNMKMMVVGGYSGVTAEELASVDMGIGEFLGVAYNRRHALELLQAAGPVLRGADFLATMESTRRWAQQADRRINVPPEVERMIDLNNEMVKARMDGDREKSERLARQILANPFWRNWAPANAIMGDLMATQGEYAAAVAYYRVATAGHLETPDLVWNNYADALFRLGEYDQAEAMLRRQIAKTDERFFALRLTLAEVLTKKAEMRGFGERKMDNAELEALRKETRALVKSVQKNAPTEYQDMIRAKQEAGDILK